VGVRLTFAGADRVGQHEVVGTVADSQYRLGTRRVSKTADKKDAPPPLGNSEPARIQNAPRDTVPESIQVHEDLSEIRAMVAAKESGNILNADPSWPQQLHDPGELKPERAALAPKTRPSTGHADVLAREAAVDEVNTIGAASPLPVCPASAFNALAVSDGAPRPFLTNLVSKYSSSTDWLTSTVERLSPLASQSLSVGAWSC